MTKSLLPIVALLAVLSASGPANACEWLNEFYAAPAGVYAFDHGLAQETVSPVSFGQYLGVDVVDRVSPHVYFVVCVDRIGGNAANCADSDGDFVYSGVDRVEITLPQQHGLAHVFIAALHADASGAVQFSSTGRAYFYFTTDCVGDPQRVDSPLPPL